MSVVLDCIRWSWRAGWRETKQQPGGLVLFFVSAPVGVGLVSLVGLWAGEQIADQSKQAGQVILLSFVALGGLVGLLSMWGEGANYVTARGLRARQRLSLLPLGPGQLYAVSFLEFMSILSVFVLPYSIACALPSLVNGRFDVALLLFVGSWFVVGGALAASRICALSAMLVPPRFGGWLAALVVPVGVAVFSARPLATWLQTHGSPLEEPGGIGALVAVIPIAAFTARPLVCLAAIAGLALAVIGVDFLAHKRIVIGCPGLLLERAVKSGSPAPWSLLSRWLERLEWPRSAPLRALLRKELTWLLRDRVLHLIPLLVVAMTSIGCVVLELFLPVALVLPHWNLAIAGSSVALALVLVVGGAVYAAASLPAESEAMRRLLESPLAERQLMLLRTLCILPFTALCWVMAWIVGAVVFGSALGWPGWILWGVGPVTVTLAAAFMTFVGVAVGVLFPRRLPEHPILAVNLLGLGIQLGLAFMALALALAATAGAAGGGSLTLLGLAVPLYLLLAGYLRSEARRRLRTMRLVA